MRLAEAHNQSPVVVQKLREHVLGRDISLVIVSDALKSRDVPNRTQGRSSDLSHPLRNCVGRREYLVALLIEKKVIVAKMRAGHMPMKILGLDVESEHVGQ